MNMNYDERELLPLLMPSTCHPSRTVKCSITADDHHAGRKLADLVSSKYGTSTLPNDKMKVHFSGVAGDYFGSGLVSGITFVADAIGSHGCSEMLGGEVLILDEPGKNFAEGLFGGCVYVYGGNAGLAGGGLSLHRIEASSQEAEHLKSLVEEHAHLTGSPKALSILENWSEAVENFVKITAA
ncbi:MAG: hypothetical protein IKS20_00740 [Victivallales bacterium]|nr:hypothetical protein [Victivallales bacterium]